MVERPLRFVTFLAPNMYPVYAFIAGYVGRRLGRATELTVGERFDVFATGQADVGFICGLPYVDLTREPPAPVTLLAAPVLAGARYGGRPIYYSDVIVRADSPFQRFSDLRGRRWAYNDRDSHSGYNITRYRLVQMGETQGFFGAVVEAGWHQRAIAMVVAGEIDAAAIDSQVLAVELRDQPELAAQVRVIDVLGPASIQPVVAGRHVPDDLQAAIQAALLGMADDADADRAVLARGFVERFVAVADGDYDDIREMVAAAAAVGFLTLK
jgi:phosphonate transport system substrate-binding protein